MLIKNQKVLADLRLKLYIDSHYRIYWVKFLKINENLGLL
jgi:hypothetical protein